ncbi:hypothetical protein GJ496_011435, partial [Pomphorhynchus laevis]
FLILMVDEIRNYKHLEGLLRKSGSISRQNVIIDNIVKGNYQFKSCNPFDLCSILKRFIRNIPGGLIPSIFHETFIGTIKHYKATREYDPLLACCLLLTKPNLHVLIFLMRFLSEIAMDHSSNRMTVENISTVFAPTIFTSDEVVVDSGMKLFSNNSASGTAASTTVDQPPARTALQTVDCGRIVISLLIRNSYRIGYIPKQIEKEANEIHIENQELALKRARSESDKQKSHWRSLSSKPAERSNHRNDDDKATKKSSHRNRSLFSRKRNTYEDAENKLVVSTQSSANTSINKSSQTSKIFPPREILTQINKSILSNKSPETIPSECNQSKEEMDNGTDNYSFKLLTNATNDLSCIVESQNEYSQCSEVNENLNVALIEDITSNSNTNNSHNVTDDYIDRDAIAKFKFKPLHEEPVLPAIHHKNRFASGHNRYDRRRAFPCMRKRTGVNPLLNAYRNCNPAKRKEYLKELMSDIVNIPSASVTKPQPVGNATSAAAFTASEDGRKFDGLNVNWALVMQKKSNFKSGKLRTNSRRYKPYQFNRSTPV